MAELDYAYLADYAVVSDGKLSTIGASFTHVGVGAFPSALNLAVAGRIRVAAEIGSVSLLVRILPPKDEYRVEFAGILEAGPQARPYGDGLVGVLFSVTATVPLPNPGLYQVEIHVDGELARRLAFDAELARSP